MGWDDQKGKGGNIGNILKLGNKEGQVSLIEGVFTGVTVGPHGLLYDFIGKAGRGFCIPHNIELDAKLSPDAHLGKLVQVEFLEMKPIRDGKTVKKLAVRIFNGEPTAQMVEDYPILQDPVDEEPGTATTSTAADEEDDDIPF